MIGPTTIASIVAPIECCRGTTPIYAAKSRADLNTLDRLGGDSEQGDRYLRRLLVIGATAVVRHAGSICKHPWVTRLLAKKPAKLVAVAVANKTARIAWAIMTKRG